MEAAEPARSGRPFSLPNIFLGTSSFTAAGWEGSFYPLGMRAKDFLRHYASQFLDCIDEFAFDYQRISQLAYGWRVRVRCPGCGNIGEIVMSAYSLIHLCDPDKYQLGEIVEILPPDPNPSPEWRLAINKLRMEILQKKIGWRPEHRR